MPNKAIAPPKTHVAPTQTTLAERLDFALRVSKYPSKAALAKAVGVERQTAYYWFSGRTQAIDSPTLLAVARSLHVRPHWLQTGEGPMMEVIEPTEEETQILMFYRRMTEDDRVVFMKMARTLAGDSPEPPNRGDPYSGKLPR